MSNLIVVKAQSEERGRAHRPVGEGERERPAGDEKNKSRNPRNKKETTDPGGQRASGRQRVGKWENLTLGEGRADGAQLPLHRAPWTGLGAAAAHTPLPGGRRKP